MSKKKLTVDQVFKKENLLSETQSKIKGHNRKEISKIWQGYRGKKYTIEYLPDYRKKLAKLKRENKTEKIEKIRTEYFDRREVKTAILQFGSLKVEKKLHQKFSEQDYYKLAKGKDLDKTIEKVFLTKNPRYVLVTLKIRLPQTGQVMFVSDTLTLDSFYNLQELKVTALEKIMEKLSFVTKYEGYEIISIHLRVIYATPEKNIGQQKHRKDKK